MPQVQIERLNAVIGENLKLLDEETFSSFERRIVQLRDRAQLLLRNDSLIESENRVEEFSAMFDYSDLPDEMPPETREELMASIHTRQFFDKLTVCRYLARELARRPKSTLGRLFRGEAATASPRIAYFRNAYADSAFRIFSEVLDTPSVFYASDFTAVCEEVYYGRADLCMLPMDSSRDAKLISFYRLIDKYELNPILSCDVISPDGGVTTRYALLGRGISLPTENQLDRCDEYFFEFTLVPDRKTTLCDVLQAARECDMTLYKVDSIPLTYTDSEFSCDVILRVGSNEGLEVFALFMSLAIPQYVPIGIYPHIRPRT